MSVDAISSLAQLQQLMMLQASRSALSAASGSSSAGGSSLTTGGLDFADLLTSLLGTQLTGSVASSPDASAATSAAPSTGPDGASVVADARKYLGVPYVLGGTTSSGIDCSGLVQRVFTDLGVSGVPRLVHQQKLVGTEVPSLAEAQPGDLIVFKGGAHIAIYEGDGRVIHAPYPGRTVSDQKLWTDDSGIETIRRIVPGGGAAASASTAVDTASTARPAVDATLIARLLTAQAAMNAQTMLNSGGTS